MLVSLAKKSLLNRKGSVSLTVLAIAVSIFVLLGVEHIRKEAKTSFANTVSGVDLIVGARTGSLNLLLYSVFRVGAPTNNIRWESYQQLAEHDDVAWAVPISLGDSHKGYRVMGTSAEYFTYFKYGQSQQLTFASGQAFNALYDVVLGAEVARKLNYKLGDSLVLAHGVGSTSFSLHEERPFTVSGILAPTGTPVDQTLHVSLEAIEAIHIDWQHSAVSTSNTASGSSSSGDIEAMRALQPKQITAALVGLHSRLATFKVQRSINDYRSEPLMAILPGVALSELWQTMGTLERTLRLVSILVLASSLLGMAAMLLASMRERTHEIQLLRIIGASPAFLFLLIQLEAILISTTGFILGSLLLGVGLLASQAFLAAEFGIHISATIFTVDNLIIGLVILAATALGATIPSLQAYRKARSL